MRPPDIRRRPATCQHARRGLKSIPPLSARRPQQDVAGAKIDVVYPPALIPREKVARILKHLGTDRNALHMKRLTWSVVGMPIVAPFALVPLVPNLPFFYLCYRGICVPYHGRAGADCRPQRSPTGKVRRRPQVTPNPRIDTGQRSPAQST